MKRLDIQKLLFFLILFFLPQQFGPHFWPSFAHVNGIRIDYLSPTLYVSDILIFFLFLFCAKQILINKKTLSFFSNRFFILFLFILITPLFYCTEPLALLYGILKLFEFLFFGLYVSQRITKRDLPTLLEILAGLGILESILSTLQFISQGSIGGVLYFVGERTYSLSTIGIAAMNTPQGLAVRPYGTFSHPNVLAFFLFMCAVFSTYAMHHAKGKRRLLFFIAVLIIECALFLTFSRTVLFVNLLFLLYSFGYVAIKESSKKIKNILFVFFLFLFTIIYLILNSIRFLNVSGIMNGVIPRKELIQIGFSAINSSFLFGVGLNNFYYYEGWVQTDFSSIYLQPVHNIFLLIAVQLGILGLVVFLYFLTLGLLSALKSVKRKRKLFSYSEVPFILLVSIIFVGLFDHFFLTVQQGQLMFALVLGLSFSQKIFRD